MPYIGKSPVSGGFHKLGSLTASATATYALTLNGAAYFPETANQLLVSLNGVIQAPQDSFTVSGSTGTNTAMTIDSDGRVGFNNPILFWGQLSNTSPFAPTANQFLSFRDDVDTASGWNSSNNYYVVPKAGYYEVHCMLLMNSQTNAGNLDFFISKNGVDNFIARGFTSAGASDYQPAVATVIQPLAANDQISIQSRSTVEIWGAVNSVNSADVSSLSIKFLG